MVGNSRAISSSVAMTAKMQRLPHGARLPRDKSVPRAGGDADVSFREIGTSVGRGAGVLHARPDSGVLAGTAKHIVPGAGYNDHGGGSLLDSAGAAGDPQRYSVLPGDNGGCVKLIDWANVFLCGWMM